MFIIKFLELFRWISGYITVCLQGEDSTLFLNHLLKNNVKIWEVGKQGNCVFFRMKWKKYRNIMQLRHAFAGKVYLNIREKIGLPFKTAFLSRRKSLVVGLAVFLAVIITLSQFVWKIEITGNKTVPDEKIVKAYTELGVKVGMTGRKLDSYSLKDRLPLMIREISWSSFNLEGSKLTINISELKESDKADKNNYSNMVASADGIIREIDIISGNKQVIVGDVVKKGDVLISGAPELNSQQFTYSKGKIYAETYKTVKVRINAFETVTQKAERKRKRQVLEIFGLKVPLYLDSVHFENVSQLGDIHFEFAGSTLPIKLYTRYFFETKPAQIEVDEEAALNEAKAKLLRYLKDYDIKSMEILSIDINELDEKYEIKFECRCIENICELKRIIVAGSN